MTPETCSAPKVIQRDEEDEEGWKRGGATAPQVTSNLLFHSIFIETHSYIFSFVHKTSVSVWRWLKNGTH